MSQSKNRHEAQRWLQTAREDLQAAEVLLKAKMYAPACFHAQQSGEKAVRALWYLSDADPWGHSVQRLISEFPRQGEMPNYHQWVELGALLDKFYIPTRYPTGLPDLTPGQVYLEEDAQRGVKAARVLIDGCLKWFQNH